jgi:hypothetical protein
MAANEWSLTARGIFSLFIPWLSVTPFAKSDVEHEATVNNAFARMSESQRDDYRKGHEIEVKKRMKTFRSGVWGSFWLLISAVIIALILRAFWNAQAGEKVLVARFIQIAG